MLQSVLRTGLFCTLLWVCVKTATGQVSAPPAPSAAEWSNSLGMKFRHVPGSDKRMGVWETRVRDFAAFVDATGHDATERFFYYHDFSWRMDTNYWRHPGFDQTPEYPVVGVSWSDAVAFCEWLTLTERSKGIITDRMAYRLPTEEEWSAAAEGTPDPMKVPNLANYHPALNIDPFPVTAPVGSFPANPHGFFDMAGNVWEFCLDQVSDRQPYRIIRGGCWQNWHRRYVGIEARGQCGIHVRITLYGFRVVLADDDAITQAMRDGI